MKSLKTLFILLFYTICSYSQINAIFNHKTFNTSKGPFLETYIYLYANSIFYLHNDQNIPKCNIEITQIIKKNDSIVDFLKYVLVNPENSINDIYEDLIDVKRFMLENDTQYELEVSIIDKNNPKSTTQTITNIIYPQYKKDFVEISDIQLISSYTQSQNDNELTKSGIAMVPMVSDFYPNDFERIAYYFEIYNTIATFGNEGKFMITHYIENQKTNQVAGIYKKSIRSKTEEIIPILYYFDIKSLATGSYNIVAQVRDENNELLVEKKTPFTRVNNTVNLKKEFLNDVEFENSFVSRMHTDSLDEYIFCLAPISGAMENRILINHVQNFSEIQKRQFIYGFWLNHDYQNPEIAWVKYHEQVKLVHQMFGTKVRRGYETDRGRIYLKYGPPNNVEDRPNEPSAYPYQIWHYYKIGQFNNKRFIFYLPDLVTNDYVVLHSDLQGEIQNFKWERDLNRRNTPTGNIDDPNEGNFKSWGTNSNVLFRNP